MTVQDLKRWLRHPHGKITYHRGMLMRDRVELIGGFFYQPHQPTDQMARLAWAAHEAGKVSLVQQRMGLNDYLYIAEAR